MCSNEDKTLVIATSGENISYSSFDRITEVDVSMIDNFIIQLENDCNSSESKSNRSDGESNSKSIKLANQVYEVSCVQSSCNSPMSDSLENTELENEQSCISRSADMASSCLELEKISVIYNKIIRLLDEKYLQENNDHNFQECYICCNNFQPFSLQNTDFVTLCKYINTAVMDKVTEDIFSAKLANNNIGGSTQILFSNNENLVSKTMFDVKCEQKINLNGKTLGYNSPLQHYDSNSGESCQLDSLLKIAKLKVQKCYNKILDISDLQNIISDKSLRESNDFLSEIIGNESASRKIEDLDRKQMNEGGLNCDVNSNNSLLFLVHFLNSISYNSMNIVEDFFRKATDIYENFVITENLPSIKILLEKIMNQTSKEKVWELPDLNPFQQLIERINSIILTKNSFCHTLIEENYFQEDLQSCSIRIAEKSKEQVRSDGDENENIGEFSRIHTKLFGSVESITSDYDSESSSFSGESNIEYVVDCENQPTRIPSKRTIYLSYLKINGPNVRKIYEFAFRMSFGVIGESVENITTHVIVPDTWKEKNLSFTYSYLAAIAQKSFIVTFQWVVDSLRAGRTLPPFSYIPEQAGALSCTEKNRRRLLEGFCIYFSDSEELESKKRNEHLATTCGAVINTNLVNQRGKKVLLSDRSVSPELLWHCFDIKMLPVHSSWLHESIYSYSVQPLKNYCLINASDEMIAYFSDEVF